MNNKLERIVIVGATSAIAEQCTRLWVSQNNLQEIFLVGRDLTKLNLIESDLTVRSPTTRINSLEVNFINPKAIEELVSKICLDKKIDLVLIAHGSLPDQNNCQNDLDLVEQAISTNATSPVLFAEAFALHMQLANHGKIVLIGSVAGDRGRKSNYVYGAAKGLVTRYAQGLQHRFAGSKVKIILVKPGPTDTPMTAHLKQQGQKLAAVEKVANEIVNGVNENKLLIYTPFKWRIIMLIIGHLPSFIFNKINI